MKDGGTNNRRTVVEEHIYLVKEPGSQYFGHVNPTSGSAKSIEASISLFFVDHSINTESLIVVGCDGTNINTGTHGGIIRLLEERLQKPLQWLVCLFHFNELPLRHLMKELDGSTAGPHATGSCHELPVVNFQKIDRTLVDGTVDISTDQQYLHDICQALSKGVCPNALAARNPGKLSHARWLTTANRILRLYIATRIPSIELQTLATYIQRVYAPMWFKIKSNPSCCHGATHVLSFIKSSRYLPEHLKAVIDPVIQRNGYFANSEKLLLSMVTSDQQHIRELGLLRILKARETGSGSAKQGIQKFNITKLNFNADNLVDIIDWQNVELTDPPIMSAYSNDEIYAFIHGSEHAETKLSVMDFPCHTQGVERWKTGDGGCIINVWF